MIKIKVGGFYRTRDGRKVGPMEPSGDRFGPYFPLTVSHDFDGGGQGIAWRADGEFSAVRHAADIVAEWVEPETLKRKFKVGDKVRRVKHTTGMVYQCPIGFETVISQKHTPEANGFWYVNNCGHLVHTRAPDDWELIEPAHQGPVRTVTTTRKVIEPGVYGLLRVHDDMSLSLVSSRDPKEILAAGKHLIEIAGAMDTRDSSAASNSTNQSGENT